MGNVEIVTKPPSKKWDATTRKNKIIIYGDCDDFFDRPDTVLEEYYHVLEQWNKGKVSRLNNGFAYLLHGYNNKYEREAKRWVDQHLQEYLECLASQK